MKSKVIVLRQDVDELLYVLRGPQPTIGTAAKTSTSHSLRPRHYRLKDTLDNSKYCHLQYECTDLFLPG